MELWFRFRCFSFFQLGVILLRFQPAPTTPLRLEASDSSCKRPKEDDPVASAGRGTRWESRNDVYIRGYLDGFFHPQESLENTIDTMGTMLGTVHPIVLLTTYELGIPFLP